MRSFSFDSQVRNLLVDFCTVDVAGASNVTLHALSGFRVTMKRSNLSKRRMRAVPMRPWTKRCCVATTIVLLQAHLLTPSEGSWVDPDTPPSHLKTNALTKGDDRQFELVRSELLDHGFRLSHSTGPSRNRIASSDLLCSPCLLLSCKGLLG